MYFCFYHPIIEGIEKNDMTTCLQLKTTSLLFLGVYDSGGQMLSYWEEFICC